MAVDVGQDGDAPGVAPATAWGADGHVACIDVCGEAAFEGDAAHDRLFDQAAHAGAGEFVVPAPVATHVDDQMGQVPRLI
jgi:hypothetical protein